MRRAFSPADFICSCPGASPLVGMKRAVGAENQFGYCKIDLPLVLFFYSLFAYQEHIIFFEQETCT
jgi:hypothetical protein